MTLGDRRNKRDGCRGIAIADAPAVEFVSVNLLQDPVCPRACMAVVNAIHAAAELASRLSRTERRILFEAASPRSLAIFRPVLERLQCDPRLECWCTTWDSLCDADRIVGGAGITERVISASHARRMKFDGYVSTDVNTPPGPASNDATIVPKP